MQSLSAHFWKNLFWNFWAFNFLIPGWRQFAVTLLSASFSRLMKLFLRTTLSFFFFFQRKWQSGNVSRNNPFLINRWYLTVSFCALTLLVLLWREYLQALTGCMPGMIKSKTSSFFCLTQRERFVDKIDLERSVGNCIEGEVVEKDCSWLVSHWWHCHHPAQWIES